MAHKSLVPKQRCLNEHETQTSFDSWKESMIFHISLEQKSSRFLSDLKTWSDGENRGFTNDPTGYEDKDSKMTAVAKAALLNIVLGSVATYAPVISARFIKNQATSLNSIWDRLRSYYGLRKTGARILEFAELRPEVNETREAVWERLYSFLEDSLLTKDGDVSHEGIKVEEDEKLTPTLLNILVGHWLHVINPALPSLVRQRFATELRNNTPFTLRDEISDCIPTLLAEMEEKEGIISRIQQHPKQKPWKPQNKRACCLCQAAGRSSTNHFLSTCPFLPPDDKKFWSRAREIAVSEDDCDYDYTEEASEPSDSCVSQVRASAPVSRSSNIAKPNIHRVNIMKSPVVDILVNSQLSTWTLDGGAEADLITVAECQRLRIKYVPSRHRATQADGETELIIVGEVHFVASWGHHQLKFGGLVVKDMGTPVLAGMPFLYSNDICINYRRCTIYFGDCCKIKFNPKKGTTPHCCRVTRQTCVLPGQELSIPLPEHLHKEKSVAVEPRSTVPVDMPDWIKCDILRPDDGSVSIKNTTSEAILLSKHTQFCQVRPVMEVNLRESGDTLRDTIAAPVKVPDETKVLKPNLSSNTDKATDTAIDTIQVDPSKILSKSDHMKFHNIHKKYQSVFSAGIGRYNGYSGKFSHFINMGSNLPPQRRGRVPIYNVNDMNTLQEKFDELERENVLKRPEDLGIAVEYIHPSFLVKKSSGGHRLVTSFGEMAEFVRPQPTSTQNVEHVIHQVGQWTYIIKADCSKSYFQIELDEESCKYVGVLTPYKGTLVYQRCVMGLPGSEAALEELLSRIFGDLIQEGKMVKLADDFYIGGNDVGLLTRTWEEVLRRMQLNGLKLNPTKTVCCPTSTTVLGWLWENGSIRPTTHKLNALAACEPPDTVRGLRSFIGVYKFISRVLPLYAEKLQPLEEACGGKESEDKITWTDELSAAFTHSQKHVENAKAIVLPRREDQLHIVTDAAVGCSGLAATLYVVRNKKPMLAGYFSAKLKKSQSKLLPCDLEALAIGTSIKHFSYLITQSKERTRVLTDSLPCVLAYRKLLRGEFSSSSKVTTFLSLASRYGVEIMHISGSSNIFSDYASRNPVKCDSTNCDICSFVQSTSEANVGEVRISDILSGSCRVPYATGTSWISVQQSCPDLNKVYKYLTTGASVPKKKKNLTDVRRYLSCGVSVASGKEPRLLVIKQSIPFQPNSERIVIPRNVSAGLLTALHVQLNHPSAHQLMLVFQRVFFSLDMSSIAKEIVKGCHTCASLKKIPSNYHEQSTSPPVETIGSKYSADVLRRCSQFILLAREDVSSYTDATIIENEKADSLRDGLLLLMSRLNSPMGPKAVIRTDPASGLRSLLDDKHLQKYNLSVELGESKNPNKNPIAEKGIEELHAEIVRLVPEGGKLSSTLLAQAVSNLNSRIRYNKLSSREIWTQREMTSNNQLSLNDKELIDQKQSQRLSQHKPSAKYKARGKVATENPSVNIGDIVYLFCDGSKLKAREKYLVVGFAGSNVIVQKFTGSQFRKREYTVKPSEIISVPIQEKVGEQKFSDKSTRSSKFNNSAAQSKPVRRKLNMPKPPGKTFSPQSHWVLDDSSSDSSDDEYIKLPTGHVPDHAAVNDQANVLEQEQADTLDAGRPVRNRRKPTYLNDYVQDISAISDDDQEEVFVVLEEDGQVDVSSDSDRDVDSDPGANQQDVRRSDRIRDRQTSV